MKRLLMTFGFAAWLLEIAPGIGDAQGQPGSMPLPLKVVGTKIVNSRGDEVRLRGVNAASLEWSSNGEGHILKTVEVAFRDWHVNHVRLPLAQDRWCGKAPEQKDGGKAYRALVQQVVDLCASHGVYIILDLHWSDRGQWGRDIGQHPMPDRNSLSFWGEVARVYKDHPAVLFDLYNEPFKVSWDVWRDGGRVTEQEKGGGKVEFDAVGMQAMLDAVRGTGAKNVVIVGGLDWSYDMSGFLKGYRLDDRSGHGIIYANHSYPFKGDSVERWVAKMETATKTLPVIVSEFGPPGTKEEPWLRQVLQALENHRWNWTAWDLHPAASPCLIADWNYTPTPFFGHWVKLALEDKLHRSVPSPDTTKNRRTWAPAAAPIGAMALLPAILPAESAVTDEPATSLFEKHQDVGEIRHPGTVAFDQAAGSYTVAGSGANMWAARDAFHYVWKRVSGDVALAADIAFLGQGKEAHRKACLIVRQDLDADSAYVDAALHGDGLTSLQFRDSKGDLTHEVQANASAPKRLRIEMKGKYVRLYLDTGNGIQFTGASVRIAFQDPFYVGIGVCAHNADVTEKAVFSNVELSTSLPVASAAPTVYSTLETMAFPSTDRRVVYVTPTRIEAPNWLPDGRTLIYNSEGRIQRIAATGGVPEVIDTDFANRCNNDHGISPDGKLLAISDQSQGRHQSLIYTLPITGGKPTLVTPTGPSYWHGWSPDGRTLAYCAERGGEFDIYTIPVEGGTETRLTTAKGLDDGPEYSPDGQWIYFNSVRTGTMQIWRMKTDGSEQEALTADGFNNWFAHPSPEGRTLVFLSYEKDVTGHPANKDVTIRRMALADRKIDVLARFYGGQGTINVPCWSPDGRKIAFVTYQALP
jgi:TolB protein